MIILTYRVDIRARIKITTVTSPGRTPEQGMYAALRPQLDPLQHMICQRFWGNIVKKS